MKASSLKFKGENCFRNGWAGFDKFCPITVIIGRNNTGKSQLLNVVHLLTSNTVKQLGIESRCSGMLDEDTLKRAFPPGTWGGDLSSNDHWEFHGRHFIGMQVKWQLESQANEVEVIDLECPQHGANYFKAREKAIARALATASAPIYGKKFRRLLADRDVQPEPVSTELELASNGRGATNIIRRFILSDHSDMREELIQTQLLEALSYVFGDDGDFRRLETRLNEASDFWEVYLGEPHKGLVSLSRSGSGLKTVILVLLNLLIMPELEKSERSAFVFAFEELENNLHPALLRRLLRCISDYVERERCTLFITTHSSVVLDFFGPRDDSQIIHVSHDGESASTKTIAAHFDHVGLLSELGCRPSDLLQANGVIWLEGPSDRIYFNRFIELFSGGELREGRDYQCAFYGGSNLANSAFSAPGESEQTFANLLRLNNNIAVVCDGDRTAESGPGSRIKGRVQRIKQEVEEIPSAFLWITDAKEIENYVPGSVWAAVYKLPTIPDPNLYDRFPSSGSKETDFVQEKLRRKSFDKCDFAMKAVDHLTREHLADRFDFSTNIESLVATIRSWNR